MDKSMALKAMLAVAGGLTAAVVATGPVQANCGSGGGGYSQSGGPSGTFEQRPQETREQREARLHQRRIRREVRRLARAEAQAAREAAAAQAASAQTAAPTVVASNN